MQKKKKKKKKKKIIKFNLFYILLNPKSVFNYYS